MAPPVFNMLEGDNSTSIGKDLIHFLSIDTMFSKHVVNFL